MALAGCGNAPDGPVLTPPAEPRTIDLGWVERHKSARFTFEVERLVIAESGWRVVVSVTNRSLRPYRLDARSVGLVLLETPSRSELRRLTGNLSHAPPALRPDRASPPPPSTLEPGASWSTTVTGPEVLRADSFVRVLFGPFSSVERFRTEVQSILWVTDHSIRI